MIKKITLLLFLIYGQSFAATIYVNQNVVGGANDGSSWANAYNELQDAFTNAIAGDEIWVAAGTYTPDWNGTTHDLDRTKQFLFDKELMVYGGFNGTESTINDRNWRTNITIISGDLNSDDTITFPSFSNVSDNTEQLIQVAGGINNSRLDGFQVSGANGIPSFGAGIMFIGNIEIRNTIFFNNQGSAVIEEPAGRSRFENCLFYHNYNDGNGTIFTHDFGTQLINCTMVYNHGEWLSGFMNGAYMVGSTIQNSIFWGNTAVNNVYTTEQINCFSASTDPNAFTSFENNIVENFSASQHQMTSGSNLSNDPLFTNIGLEDFTIQDMSPGKDAGNNSFSTTSLDLNLDLRIENGTIDIGCFETTTPLSVDEFNINSIVIYPNPTTDRIWIQGPQTVLDKISYSILDINGKLIASNNKFPINRSISFSGFASGIYILQLKNSLSNERATLKIIRE